MTNLSFSMESDPRGVPQQAPSRESDRKKPARPRIRRERARHTANDESELIARLKLGEPDALEIIFNRYSTRLHNVAQRIIGDLADTEEVIQDVFWTAYRKARTFRGTAQFSTWLYRLTLNAALGRLRRSKRRREVPYEEFLPNFEKDGHHRVRPVIDWSNSVERRYAEHERRQFIKEALEALRPMDKSVVVLSDIEGMSDKEIAAILGITVSAVKTRLHRARLILRGKLAARLGHGAI